MNIEIDYFLFYKHQNRAWGIRNFSFIVIPKGDVYTFNSNDLKLDILGNDKRENPTNASQEDLLNALDKGEVMKTKIPFELEINGVKALPLEQDKAKMIWDAGYEKYSVYKINPQNNEYEDVSLQILDSYYFRAKKSNNYKELINRIDFYKEIVKHKIETYPIRINPEFQDEEFLKKNN